MQNFDGEDYRPALPVFFSGERANGGALPFSIASSSPPPASPPPALNKMASSRGVLPRILDRGVPRRFGPYLRTKKAKTDSLFKAQSRKMTPYSRKKQKFGLNRRYVYLPA